MSIGLPTSNKSIELKMRERAIHSHAKALKNTKSGIDTSKPPENPRLLLWRKRLFHDMTLKNQVEKQHLQYV